MLEHDAAELAGVEREAAVGRPSLSPNLSWQLRECMLPREARSHNCGPARLRIPGAYTRVK
jgi:hypothetical protein